MPQGYYQGSFWDWGSFGTESGGTFTPREPVYWDGTNIQNSPQLDDLDLTVIELNSLTYDGIVFGVGGPGQPEILAQVYDLKVTSVQWYKSDGATTDLSNEVAYLEVGLGNTTRFDDQGYTGGRIDIWQSDTVNFGATSPTDDHDPDPPTSWGFASGTWGGTESWYTTGNYDNFPDINPDGGDAFGAPWASGTFVDDDDDGEVMLLTLYIQDVDDHYAGTGRSSVGLIEILDSQLPTPFQKEYTDNDNLYHMKYDNFFEWYPYLSLVNPYQYESAQWPYEDPTKDPVEGDQDWWATRSYDNPTWTLIPEPATLTLLGMGVVGLCGIVARRRKRAG